MTPFERIKKELAHAKSKHPQFMPEGLYQAMSVLMEEVGEAAQALNDGDHGHMLTELAQVCTVSVRMIEAVDPVGARRKTRVYLSLPAQAPRDAIAEQLISDGYLPIMGYDEALITCADEVWIYQESERVSDVMRVATQLGKPVVLLGMEALDAVTA